MYWQYGPLGLEMSSRENFKRYFPATNGRTDTLEPGPLAIEWLLSGAVVTLGGLIKFSGWTWLLAGYSEPTAPKADDVVQDVAKPVMESITGCYHCVSGA